MAISLWHLLQLCFAINMPKCVQLTHKKSCCSYEKVCFIKNISVRKHLLLPLTASTSCRFEGIAFHQCEVGANRPNNFNFFTLCVPHDHPDSPRGLEKVQQLAVLVVQYF